MVLPLAAFWAGLLVIIAVIVIDVRAGASPQAAALVYIVKEVFPAMEWAAAQAVAWLLCKLRW